MSKGKEFDGVVLPKPARFIKGTLHAGCLFLVGLSAETNLDELKMKPFIGLVYPGFGVKFILKTNTKEFVWVPDTQWRCYVGATEE